MLIGLSIVFSGCSGNTKTVENNNTNVESNANSEDSKENAEDKNEKENESDEENIDAEDSEDKEDTEDSDEEETETDKDSDDENVGNDEENSSASETEGDLIGGITTFAEQFVDYAALAYHYPEYSFTEFDDKAKCYIIFYANRYTYDYVSDNNYIEDKYCMTGDRVQLLANRFFAEDVNIASVPDALTSQNEDEVLTSDNDNNLIGTVGDWGMENPKIKKVEVEPDGDNYKVAVSVVMYDGFEDKEREIGTFKMNLKVDEDGNYIIVDFEL